MKSTRALAGLCLLFLLAFFVQRSRSAFLTIENGRSLAGRVAEQADMTVVEVMALRELLGLDLSEDRLQEAAERFALLREEMQDDLAVLAVAGHEDLARSLWKEAGEDPTKANVLLRPRPEAIVPVRFKIMMKQFARRLSR